MSKKIVVALMAASFAFVCLMAVPVSADHHEPKHKIKDVMKKAMKGGLLKKVAQGKASDEEKKSLHEMLESLAKNKAPKGEADSWKKLTAALVKASKDVNDGKDGAGAALQKASNCKACHSKHKP